VGSAAGTARRPGSFAALAKIPAFLPMSRYPQVHRAGAVLDGRVLAVSPESYAMAMED